LSAVHGPKQIYDRVQTMSLTRSLIPQQHRPIFDQLLVRLSLRHGQDPSAAFHVRNVPRCSEKSRHYKPLERRRDFPMRLKGL
jgi:hypothetical protein